ncbi:MAG TPA: TlpA disulfide reductase family protein [Pyrinomonadaceae bacterium]|nr:TlpA disulfide reductase family protein [Pyrinomonadaceae bacterium]
MKFIFALVIALSGVGFALGQGGNEQSPIVDKEIAYKNWVYKNVQTGADIDLRNFANGKKLVVVVYFAPWCPNWKHDVRFVQSMYDKYKGSGLEVIAVGEYDPVDSIKAHIAEYKLTFPVVWESDARTAKQTTSHYEYRKAVGDTRNWGSPWYIFLEGSKLERSGPVIVKKAPVVNGELIQPDAEKFIREKLGLKAEASAGLTKPTEIEVCEPEKKTAALAKP